MMMRELAKEAAVKVDGEWRILRAVLVRSGRGCKVIYFDVDGREVHSEPFYQSQFQDSPKLTEAEKGKYWFNSAPGDVISFIGGTEDNTVRV